MQLTEKQELGLKEALTRHKAGEKFVTIGGYAGTGKSTLVRFIIDALNVEESKVAYCSYTGKAAEVLRKKGNKNAMTLHRLLYDSIPRPGGGFLRIPKQELEYTVIVVDEISMVPKSMLDMLLKHRVFVILLGDPFQLPMIDRDQSHTFLDHPHVFLDQIMRQAAESEIIQLTLKIREQKSISNIKGNEVIVDNKDNLVTGHMTWADQIICATNQTRIGFNNQMRELLGFEGPLPHNGERMICLHNYWDDCSETGESVLVNGMTGTIINPFLTNRYAPRFVKMRDHCIPLVQGQFKSDDGQIFNHVDMDEYLIRTGEPFLDWRESYALGKIKMKYGDFIPRAFTYSYAITAHKSQGSEWDKVLVLEESFPFDRTEHARWLYTACTRASSKLVLLR